MDADRVTGRDAPRRRGLVIAALVAVLGTLLSVTGAWWEARRTGQAYERAFARETAALAATVELELQRYASAALAASAVVGARPGLDAGDYERAMRRVGVGSALPAVTATNYLAYVPSRRLDAFVAQRRRDGAPGFAVHPAGDSPRGHAPITFLHPDSPANAGALGFDALSNQIALPAMRASRRTGRPQLSDGLRIVQEREDQTGMIIYVPVRDAEQRFLGWTNAVFRGQDFLDGIVGVNERVAVRVTDATPDGPRVIGSLPHRHGFGATDALRTTRTLTPFGQRWQAEFEALPGLRTGGERRAPWIVLIAGLGGTAVLVALAAVVAGGERRALTEVDARTADLVATNAELQRASSVKDAFMANMSHEIRTPLNGVIGVTDVLATTTLDDRQRRLLDVLRTAGAQLLAVVDAVLDLSRVERGDLSLDRVPFAVAGVVSDVVTLFASAAADKGVELRSHVAAALPAQVCGDVVRVRQILTNLVNNAVRYTDEGAVELHALPGATAAVVRFEVADTGIGVPPDARARIFEPFVQADVSDTRRYGGTGLGLTICRELADALGGTIGIAPREGGGSVFWVELPLPAAALDPEGARTAAASGPARVTMEGPGALTPGADGV